MSQTLILELIGIPVIFLLGSIFHFIYKYGGQKKWMAIISPVNESIWEHLKIAFYPGLLYLIIHYLIAKPEISKFFTTEHIGINIMMVVILFSASLYPKLLKRFVLAIDLFIFFVAISLSQFISYYLYENTNINIPLWIILLIIIGQTVMFGMLSYKPMRIEVFKDPVDGQYGIKSILHL